MRIAVGCDHRGYEAKRRILPVLKSAGHAVEDFGCEGVVAVVVARPGQNLEPAALVAGLKARIANFKVPKHVFVVAELPRNAMGKVQKKLLREQHEGLFATS